MARSHCSAVICKSAAISDSFGHKGAFFLGVHHYTESLLSVMKLQLKIYIILLPTCINSDDFVELFGN